MIRIFRRGFLAWVLLIWCMIGINAFVILTSWSRTVSPSYDGYEVWLVLWASVTSDGLLSPILQKRVDAALAAYKEGVIQAILVSGYDSEDHLEAVSMSDYLLESGVSDDDILIDGWWYDTRASMQNAAQEFELDKVIVFTQRYHLWRSLWYARAADLDAVWYAVDTHPLSRQDFGTTREVFARIKSVVEVVFGDGN